MGTQHENSEQRDIVDRLGFILGFWAGNQHLAPGTTFRFMDVVEALEDAREEILRLRGSA